MRRLVSLTALALLAACSPDKGSNAPAPAPQASDAQSAAPAARQRGLIRDFAGTPAPDLALEVDVSGKSETIADILAANPGKMLLVNLWATWCAPCLKELPTLDSLAADTGDRLVVVPVSQDMEGWRKVSAQFDGKRYPHLATRLESQTRFAASLQAGGLPLTILYGADGREVWRYAGDRDWNSAESRALIFG